MFFLERIQTIFLKIAEEKLEGKTAATTKVAATAVLVVAAAAGGAGEAAARQRWWRPFIIPLLIGADFESRNHMTSISWSCMCVIKM